MTLTSKDIRELADKKWAEAMNCGYEDAKYLRLLRLASEGNRIAQNLDDLKELIGVSHLCVEINDRP